MKTHSDARKRRSYLVLIVVLLMAVAVGCSCGQVFQEWLTQFLQDLKDAIESWIREQVALFLAHLQQQIKSGGMAYWPISQMAGTSSGMV